MPHLRFSKVLRFTVPFALLGLGACAAAPLADHPPVLAAGHSFARQMSDNAEGQWPAEDWWRGGGNAELAALIEEGLAHSPSLATAAARMRAAQAQVGQARGATLPALDLSAKGGLAKQSYNFGMPKQYVPQGWQENGEVGASLSFDLDLWGRNRAALAAATSEARAAQLDADQARLLLTTGITRAYVDLVRLEADHAIHQQLFTSRKQAQALVSQRQAQGLENQGGLSKANAELAMASADLQAGLQAIAERRHQLAALLGAGPDRGETIAAPAMALPLIAGVPQGITTELVARRPDIIAARARAQAAASRLKVARADFFPAINLGALIGVQSLGLANLFEGDSVMGHVGPAISLPVFHGGAVRGRYRSAEAGRDAAFAEYEGAVVTAYQQVADAITARDRLTHRLAASDAALEGYRQASAIADQRYRAGLTSRLDALRAQDARLQAELVASGVTAARRIADIDLIQALGSGLTVPLPPHSKEVPHG